MPGGHEDPSRKIRKRGFEADSTATPPSKRAAVEGGNPSQSHSPDRVRANVRALFSSYNDLINRSGGPVDAGAFQALLKAAQGETACRKLSAHDHTLILGVWMPLMPFCSPATGDITSQRLAARLVPRFIDCFPDQVEVAASALVKLCERYQDLGGAHTQGCAAWPAGSAAGSFVCSKCPRLTHCQAHPECAVQVIKQDLVCLRL
jgi:hypothetical protein